MSGVDSIATIAESPFTLTFFVLGLYNAIVTCFLGRCWQLTNRGTHRILPKMAYRGQGGL